MYKPCILNIFPQCHLITCVHTYISWEFVLLLVLTIIIKEQIDRHTFESEKKHAHTNRALCRPHFSTLDFSSSDSYGYEFPTNICQY